MMFSNYLWVTSTNNRSTNRREKQNLIFAKEDSYEMKRPETWQTLVGFASILSPGLCICGVLIRVVIITEDGNVGLYKAADAGRNLLFLSIFHLEKLAVFFLEVNFCLRLKEFRGRCFILIVLCDQCKETCTLGTFLGDTGRQFA